MQAISDPEIDLVAFEKEKIKGAIRTDFILSAEIIVLVLGTVRDAAFPTQVMVVSGVAILITFIVYGLVAGIVKLDDLGLYLMHRNPDSIMGKLKNRIGVFLLWLAPYMMKTLSIVGTAAMFLVGGGILLHGMPIVYEQLHHINELMRDIPTIGGFLGAIAPTLTTAVVGIIFGGLVLLLVTAVGKITGLFR